MNLFKIENNELSNKLRYLYSKNNSNNNWKEKYKVICKIKGLKPIEQGDLSDYEFFIKIHPYKNNNPSIINYFLIDNDIPVTYLTLKNIDGVIDITFATSSKFQGKGYATASVQMLEKLLFADSNIKGIRLLDQLSTGGATTKIAKKLGFEKIAGDTTCYIKNNLNYISKRSVI